MLLFNEIAYGPIHSRRLGVSLGLNVMPLDAKLCTFDCVYCECGFMKHAAKPHIPTVGEYSIALENKLIALRKESIVPDVLTFSGNGEPTLHPDFLPIMKATVALRDKYCPNAKVSVLSNSTQLSRPDVCEALLLSDNRILKLDSAVDATMHIIDRPLNTNLTVRHIVDKLKMFGGDFTLQTCFLRGEYGGQTIDNTTEEELAAWYKAVEELRPKQIMIYVIDRETPVSTLEKIPKEEMERIAEELAKRGFNVMVSA